MSESAPRIILEADGGSRGNPGVAGYGALLLDERTGSLLAERAEPLGTGVSNNVAEYSGLIAGLQAVLELGLADDTEVRVRMDSKLVVEQMAGRWKIKHADMRRLAMQARDLVHQVEWAGGSVSWQWIPRADNGAADALSNTGMDGESVHRDHVRADAPGQPERSGSGPGSVADDVLSAETTPTLEGQVRLVLVRHGVTDLTVGQRLDGRGGLDPALNAAGRAQAAAAAAAVRELVQRSEPGPVSVVTSSLGRARETGAAIAEALGTTPTQDRDWDEQSFGDWDGAAVADLARTHQAELQMLRDDVDYARPGGESHAELSARVHNALQRVLESGAGGTVVVATHRKPIMCVLADVLEIPGPQAWRLAQAPASLTALEYHAHGGVQVAFVNQTHHLP